MSERTEITAKVKSAGIKFTRKESRYVVTRGEDFLGYVERNAYWTTRGDHVVWSARFASRSIATNCVSRNEAALALLFFHESRTNRKIVDNETGSILRRPLEEFFNYGEAGLDVAE